jgi:uncharacterized coiled-coil protein SlyX
VAQAVVPPPDGGYPNFTTAEGQNALKNLTTGSANTAVGWFSLFSDTEGSFNTATGAGALLFNTNDNNTAFGAAALLFNTTGTNNTAVGTAALLNSGGAIDTPNGGPGSNNTAVGFGALANNTQGNSNTALGFEAGTNLNTGSNNIYLGSNGVATEDNTIRIGTAGTQDRAFIRGIRGVTTGNNDAIPVMIDTAGQLGTTSSSRRYKKDIKAMEQASKAILSLKPVTFHYKSDTKDTPQFGLIAEEVAEVNPDLVVRDENGEIYTVRYDAVNAMLLNEFLKEHRKNEEQEATVSRLKSTVAKQDVIIAQQQKGMEAVTARLNEQAAQIQKVSAQIEVSTFATGRIRGGGPAAKAVASDQ